MNMGALGKLKGVPCSLLIVEQIPLFLPTTFSVWAFHPGKPDLGCVASHGAPHMLAWLWPPLIVSASFIRGTKVPLGCLDVREALAVCTPPAPEPSAKRPGS